MLGTGFLDERTTPIGRVRYRSCDDWRAGDTTAGVSVESRTRRPAVTDPRLNLDIAWRSHAAQESWTGKADAKASIFLAMDGAVLAGVLAARAQKGSYLHGLGGWPATILIIALILCAAGALLAATATFPLLGDPRRRGHRPGTIFFGDLRVRQNDDLSQQLAALTIDEQFSQVAHQLIAMSRASWIKHRLMQGALAVAILGYLLIFIVLVG